MLSRILRYWDMLDNYQIYRNKNQKEEKKEEEVEEEEGGEKKEEEGEEKRDKNKSVKKQLFIWIFLYQYD